MNSKKIRWITETAVLLALLLTLQAVTKPVGQLLTGSCVNAVLAVAAMVGGLSCGLVIAVISPVAAYLLGIAPQILTVPAIMVGNAVYILLLYFIAGKSNGLLQRAAAWIVAAAGKFAVLYLIVVKIICGVAAQSLMAAGSLKEPMIAVLTVNFGMTQLFTALIGGAVALAIVPVIRKALHR